MAERGVEIDHTTLNRWVIMYAPLVAVSTQKIRRLTQSSWHMDETYIKVRGKRVYLYRAVDMAGYALP